MSTISTASLGLAETLQLLALAIIALEPFSGFRYFNLFLIKLRYVKLKGDHFVNGRYIKGIPFLSKMTCKRVRGLNLGRSLSPPPPSLGSQLPFSFFFFSVERQVQLEVLTV